MKVYAVSSGEYSDYSIDAVFATRELAYESITRDMTIKDIENWEANPEGAWVRIEEWDVFDSLERIEVWHANNDFYGNWRSHPELVYVQDTDNTEEKAWTYINPRDKKIFANGRAMTAERAMKIARDAYAKAKAEKAGI